MVCPSVSKLGLSRLMLGTAQLGLDYGIANPSGKPPYEAARAILETAYEWGVNCLDTARAYGNAEEVVGRSLAELRLADKMVVVTKVPPVPRTATAPSDIDRHVEDSVTASLRALRLEAIPVCLFHREDNFIYVESLLKLRERGLVKHLGSSTHSPAGTSQIIETGLAEAVQFPTNLLDRRFTRAGIFAAAKEKNMAVFVRSVYLQGLLLMAEADVPAFLVEAIPAIQQVKKLAAEADMSMAELATRYVLGLEGITSLVIGAESADQARENAALVARGPLEAELVNAVQEVVPDLPERILNPGLWGTQGAPQVKK